MQRADFMRNWMAMKLMLAGSVLGVLRSHLSFVHAERSALSATVGIRL